MTSIALPKNPIIVPLSKPLVGAGAPANSVQLTSHDYQIRSLTPADVTEEFVTWFNAAELQSGPRFQNQNFTLPSLQSFIAMFDNHRNYFLGIFYGEELVGFYVIDVNLPHRIANLAVGIGKRDNVHRLILSATMPALFEAFYAERNIDKFVARALANNQAILAKFMSVGQLTLEAKLKQDWLASDGSRIDMLVFASYRPVPAAPQPPEA